MVITVLCCVSVAGGFILVGIITSLGQCPNVGVVHMVLLYGIDITVVQTLLSLAVVSLVSSRKAEDVGSQGELQVWHITGRHSCTEEDSCAESNCANSMTVASPM